jgi:predicted nucleic acid-binding protein
MRNYIFDREVTSKVIGLRRATSIKLSNVIAATALVNELELWMHNLDDFKHVPKLRLFDPIPSWRNSSRYSHLAWPTDSF